MSINIWPWIGNFAKILKEGWNNLKQITNNFKHGVIWKMLHCKFSLACVAWISLPQHCMAISRNNLNKKLTFLTINFQDVSSISKGGCSYLCCDSNEKYNTWGYVKRKILKNQSFLLHLKIIFLPRWPYKGTNKYVYVSVYVYVYVCVYVYVYEYIFIKL